MVRIGSQGFEVSDDYSTPSLTRHGDLEDLTKEIALGSGDALGGPS